MPVMKMKSTDCANSDENMSKMGKGLKRPTECVADVECYLSRHASG